MAQCIAYVRVSTKSQAWGHGLVRQLECIQAHAQETKHWIRSVYCDIGSGTKHLPQRELALAEHLDTGYPIFVESMDRFTRTAEDEPLLRQLNIVWCSSEYRLFASRIEQIVREAVNGTP